MAFSGMLVGSSGDQAASNDDQAAFDDIVQIGIAGLINCVLMMSIIMWRGACYVFYTARRERIGYTFWKRVVFHLLLLLAIVSDIPMYASFIQIERYELKTYAFHKLESGFMFIAYSVVVSDWLAVLRDINEDSEHAYICKWWALVLSNVAVITICLWNFIECFKQSGIVDFTQGPIYSMGVISQFASVLVLTVVILHSGLKLAYRLRTATEGIRQRERMNNSQGSGQHITDTEERASGAFSSPTKKRGSDNTNGSPGNPSAVEDRESSKLGFVDSEAGSADQPPAAGPGTSPGQVANSRVRHSTSSGIEVQGWTKKRKLAIRQSRQKEFLSALRRLNIVMAACVLCNLLCITMLGLNFVLGYESSAREYIFNVYLFWACYAWIPLWGPVLALLYLVTPQKNKRGSRRGRRRRLKRSTSNQLLDKSADWDGAREANSGGKLPGVIKTDEVSVDLQLPPGGAEDLTARLLPVGNDAGDGNDTGKRQNSSNKNNNINIIGFEGDNDAVLSGSRSGSHRVSVSSSISDDDPDHRRGRVRSGRGNDDGSDEYDDGSDYGDDYDSEDASDDDEKYGYDYEYHYDSSSLASTSTVTDSVTSSILSEFSLADGPRDVFRQSHSYQSRGSFSQGGQMPASIRKAALGANNPGAGSYQPPSAGKAPTTSPRSEPDSRGIGDQISPPVVYLSSGQGGARGDRYRYDSRNDDYSYISAVRRTSNGRAEEGI